MQRVGLGANLSGLLLSCFFAAASALTLILACFHAPRNLKRLEVVVAVFIIAGNALLLIEAASQVPSGGLIILGRTLWGLSWVPYVLGVKYIAQFVSMVDRQWCSCILACSALLGLIFGAGISTVCSIVPPTNLAIPLSKGQLLVDPSTGPFLVMMVLWAIYLSVVALPLLVNASHHRRHALPSHAAPTEVAAELETSASMYEYGHLSPADDKYFESPQVSGSRLNAVSTEQSWTEGALGSYSILYIVLWLVFCYNFTLGSVEAVLATIWAPSSLLTSSLVLLGVGIAVPPVMLLTVGIVRQKWGTLTVARVCSSK